MHVWNFSTFPIIGGRVALHNASVAFWKGTVCCAACQATDCAKLGMTSVALFHNFRVQWSDFDSAKVVDREGMDDILGM
jgi:hypothetical protein